MLSVDSLDKGIVIDHIRAGGAMKVYDWLHLDKHDGCVAIIMNVKSRKMGKKDIIKIDGDCRVDLDLLGFLDDNMTANIIEDGRIIEKKKLSLPAEVRGVIACRNPRCITKELPSLTQRFILADPERAIYRCAYCEHEFAR